MIVLSPLWGTAQGDSVITDGKQGTIRIARPPVIPKVFVIPSYSVSPSGKSSSKKKNRSSSKGRQKIAAFIGDRNNMRSTGVDYPVPTSINNLIRTDSMVIAALIKDGPVDNGYKPDIAIMYDYSEFFEKNVGYTYKYLDAPTTDTVMLKISISKTGAHSYSYALKSGGERLVERKCFEVLSHIIKWSPAKIKYYNAGGTKIRRKKKVPCEITLTVILNAQQPSDSFEQLWQEVKEQ